MEKKYVVWFGNDLTGTSFTSTPMCYEEAITWMEWATESLLDNTITEVDEPLSEEEDCVPF